MTPSELAVLLRLDETDEVVAGAPWVSEDGSVNPIPIEDLPPPDVPQLDPEQARASRLRLIQGMGDA